MASPSEDPPSQANEKDNIGSTDIFGQGGGFGEGGTSAFGFLNSASEAANSQPQVESVFSFLNSAEVAEPTPAPLQEGSPLGGGSAFAFLSGGSAGSQSSDHEHPIEVPGMASAHASPSVPSITSAPTAASVPGIASIPVASSAASAAVPESGARRKTRKALLPGHASRPQEAAGVEPPRQSVSIPEESPFEEKPPLDVQAAAKPPPPPEPAPMPHLPASLDQLAAMEAEQAKAQEPAFEQRPPLEQVEGARIPEDPKSQAGYTERLEEAPVVATLPKPPVPEQPRAAPTPSPVEPKAKAKPPPPPPPPSPEEQLKGAFNVSGVWQWLDEQKMKSEKEQKHLLEEEAVCLSESQRTAEKIASLRVKLEETEAEQNTLCEQEEYEKADALDATIQELKDKISRELEEVAIGAKKLVSFAEHLLSLTRDRASLSKQALERVEAIQGEEQEEFQRNEERCQLRVNAEEARIEAERKRMDLAQSHLEKDGQNLNEEWQQVNEAIDQQTTEDAAERDKSVSEREKLDEEIKELERSLAEKMEQRKRLTQDIDSRDIKIACIRNKFEKQLGRLEGKQKRLEEAQKEMELDTQQVSQMELELKKEREALEGQGARHQFQMKEIQRTSKSLRRQRWFLAEVIQRRVVWQKLMEPHRHSLSQARSKWESATQKCVELSSASAGQEAEAAKLRSQIDIHVEMLPKLEAEKKLAVTSRSFKEAGRLTEEIRRRDEEKKTLEAKLETLQAGLQGAREELATCRQAEQEAEAELLKVEETCAIEELRVLRHQVKDLEDLCKSLSITDRRLYEQEIAVLRHQQEHLSKKYSVNLASLEDISQEVIEELQEKNDMELPSDDEEEEAEQVPNGTSEPGMQPQQSDAPASSEIAQDASEEVTDHKEAAEAEKDAGEHGEPAESESPAPAEPTVPLSPKSAQDRIGQLKTSIKELKAEIDPIEAEIDKAVEAEQFEHAEELENKRLDLSQKLEVFEKELDGLEKDMPKEVEAEEEPKVDGEEAGTDET